MNVSLKTFPLSIIICISWWSSQNLYPFHSEPLVQRGTCKILVTKRIFFLHFHISFSLFLSSFHFIWWEARQDKIELSVELDTHPVERDVNVLTSLPSQNTKNSSWLKISCWWQELVIINHLCWVLFKSATTNKYIR